MYYTKALDGYCHLTIPVFYLHCYSVTRALLLSFLIVLSLCLYSPYKGLCDGELVRLTRGRSSE